jgi:hypothetical protein
MSSRGDYCTLWSVRDFQSALVNDGPGTDTAGGRLTVFTALLFTFTPDLPWHVPRL